MTKTLFQRCIALKYPAKILPPSFSFSLKHCLNQVKNQLHHISRRHTFIFPLIIYYYKGSFSIATLGSHFGQPVTLSHMTQTLFQRCIALKFPPKVFGVRMTVRAVPEVGIVVFYPKTTLKWPINFSKTFLSAKETQFSCSDMSGVDFKKKNIETKSIQTVLFGMACSTSNDAVAGNGIMFRILIEELLLCCALYLPVFKKLLQLYAQMVIFSSFFKNLE